MALSSFTVIVTTDSEWGMSRQNIVPWDNQEVANFFRSTTIGGRRNAVVMGASTFKFIGSRPLVDRKTFVISTCLSQTDYQGVAIYSSIREALHNIGETRSMFDDVFVMGGSAIVNEFLGRYSYLCKKIILTKFKLGHRCDKFFPKDILSYAGVNLAKKESTNSYDRHYYDVQIKHPEEQYISLAKIVLSQSGYHKSGPNTPKIKKIFGEKECHLKFDLSETIPILTGSRRDYVTIINELLLYLKGNTDLKLIDDGKGEKSLYWKEHISPERLQSRGFEYEEGDMGPTTGFQWRHYGAEYKTAQDQYNGLGIDQLSLLIENIKNNPQSDRLALTSWNVNDLLKMVDSPLSPFVQFEVVGDTKLDILVYLSNIEIALELPNAISLYGMLGCVIAHLTSLKPNFLKIKIGKAYIHHPNEENMEKLVKRCPLPFPKLFFKRKHELKTVDDFSLVNFEIQNYEAWDRLSFKIVC